MSAPKRRTAARSRSSRTATSSPSTPTPACSTWRSTRPSSRPAAAAGQRPATTSARARSGNTRKPSAPPTSAPSLTPASPASARSTRTSDARGGAGQVLPRSFAREVGLPSRQHVDRVRPSPVLDELVGKRDERVRVLVLHPLPDHPHAGRRKAGAERSGEGFERPFANQPISVLEKRVLGDRQSSVVVTLKLVDLGRGEVCSARHAFGDRLGDHRIHGRQVGLSDPAISLLLDQRLLVLLRLSHLGVHLPQLEIEEDQ